MPQVGIHVPNSARTYKQTNRTEPLAPPQANSSSNPESRSQSSNEHVTFSNFYSIFFTWNFFVLSALRPHNHIFLYKYAILSSRDYDELQQLFGQILKTWGKLGKIVLWFSQPIVLKLILGDQLLRLNFLPAICFVFLWRN